MTFDARYTNATHKMRLNVRDFAYSKTDARHRGVYPPKSTSPQPAQPQGFFGFFAKTEGNPGLQVYFDDAGAWGLKAS